MTPDDERPVPAGVATTERGLAQSEAIREITLLALSAISGEGLLDATVTWVMSALDAPLVTLAMAPQRGAPMTVVASAGWRHDVVGRAVDDLDALRAVSDEQQLDADVELLPGVARILAEHGCRQTCGTVIRAGGGVRGFLSAHHTTSRRFSEHDVAFARAVATLLGLAIDRRDALHELSLSHGQLSTLVHQLPAIVWQADRDLRVTFSAGSGQDRLAPARDTPVGLHLDQIYGGPAETVWLEAHRQVLLGDGMSIEAPHSGGVWSARLEPVRGLDGQVVGVIAVAVEVSGLRR